MVNDSEKRGCLLRPAIWRRLAAVLLVWLATVSVWAAPKVTATLDRAAITLGETVNLTLSFKNCVPLTEPILPAVPGIQALGTSSGTQVELVSGVTSQTATITYQLRPTQAGDFTIPSFRGMTSDKQPYVTAPCALKVIKDASVDSDNMAFVKIIVPKQKVYVGESMIMEIHGYCRSVAGKVAQGPQLQPFKIDGVNAGQVVDYSRSASQVALTNGIYFDVIYRLPIAPTKVGKLTLGPVTWTINYAFGRRDFFGNFSQTMPVTVTSDTPEIQVLPLPDENVPAGFSGAVGNFALEAYEAAPTNVAAGDPITLKWRIGGRGTFESVMLPAAEESWREFKTYAPTSKFDTQDPFQLEGSKYFERVVAPQNTGIQALPAFQFSFFDPDKKIYQTLIYPAIPLTVRPTAATPQPTVFAATQPSAESAPPAQEIVHIKPAMGAVCASAKPLVQRPGFLALQFAAPILWIGSIVWRRRKEHLAANPRLRRQREVARLVEKGIQELRGQVQGNQPDEFYAGVFRLLQEQLGERLDLPATAITEAALDELEGVQDETLQSLRELFHICNQYRYAPQRGEGELNSLLARLEAALAALRAAPARTSAVKSAGVAAVFLVLLTAMSAQASDADTAFAAANKLYEQGKYSEAATVYRKIIQSGTLSPILYFNLGNACFKSSHPGEAIWAYRKAELLAPRDPDIRANLQFARNQVGLTKTGEGVWLRAIHRLSINEWAGLTSAAVALFFLLLTERELKLARHPSPAKPFSGALWLAVALSVVFGTGLSASVSTRILAKASVVVVPESVVRRGPLAESPSVSTLRDGAEVEILDSNNDWYQVVDSSKHTGWIPARDVAVIND